jgi:hypothetical protein
MSIRVPFEQGIHELDVIVSKSGLESHLRISSIQRGIITCRTQPVSGAQINCGIIQLAIEESEIVFPDWVVSYTRVASDIA